MRNYLFSYHAFEVKFWIFYVFVEQKLGTEFPVKNFTIIIECIQFNKKSKKGSSYKPVSMLQRLL